MNVAQESILVKVEETPDGEGALVLMCIALMNRE